MLEKRKIIYVMLNKKFIKQRLSDLGLSQYKLAKMLGVERQQLYRWMRGLIFPRVDNLYKVSKILECKIDDLIYVTEVETTWKIEKN